MILSLGGDSESHQDKVINDVRRNENTALKPLEKKLIRSLIGSLVFLILTGSSTPLSQINTIAYDCSISVSLTSFAASLGLFFFYLKQFNDEQIRINRIGNLSDP